MFHLIFDVLVGFGAGIIVAMIFPQQVTKWKNKALDIIKHKCER